MAPFVCVAPDGVKLAGDLFLARGRSRATVVLAHGLPSAQAVADPSDEGYPGLARRITELGFDTAIFNFRGTGMSGGHLEVERWPDDLGAVFDYLDHTEAHRSFYAVVGFSAGAAAAIVRSSRDGRVNPLITLAAPADFSFLPLDTDAAAWFALYRQLGMIRDGYEKTPEQWAAGFTQLAPREAIAHTLANRVYLLHGTNDELVPVTHAGLLAKAAGEKAQTVLIAGGIHQLRRDERAMQTLLDVLKRALPQGQNHD